MSKRATGYRLQPDKNDEQFTVEHRGMVHHRTPSLDEAKERAGALARSTVVGEHIAVRETDGSLLHLALGRIL